MEPVTKNLPVIAMRGLNVFPRMNTSFDLERPISVHALERAMENGEEIFLVTQREIGVEQPEEKRPVRDRHGRARDADFARV